MHVQRGRIGAAYVSNVFCFSGKWTALFFKAGVSGAFEGICPGNESCFFDTGMIDSDPEYRLRSMENLKEADFVYLDVHGGLPYFKSFDQYRQIV